MIRNDTIYVNVISRHLGHWAMFTSFQQAAGYATQNGYRIMLSPHIGDSLVCRARNVSMMDFLEKDAAWYFTLDDDVAIPPDCFVKLIEANKDMVGGFYRLKKDYVEGDDLAEYIAFRMKEGHTFDLLQEEPVEVNYISSGCVMHKRSFIEEMIAHYPEREYEMNVSGRKEYALYTPFIHNKEYLSEDWAFCQRALDKGYKLYMKPDVLCEHWGLQKYNFDKLIN